MADSFWERRVLPHLIEQACHPRTTARYRESLCAGLAGEVLEWGFGAGANLGFYPETVTRVFAVEPSDVAWARSSNARAGFAGAVSRAGLDGARIELPDDSVDAVVSAWTMCTIPDLPAALGEARRVLRPGGELRFVEHGIAPDAAARTRGFQRRVQPAWGRLAGGCHIDRDIAAAMAGAGFDVPDLRQGFVMRGPSAPWSYFSSGAGIVREPV